MQALRPGGARRLVVSACAEDRLAVAREWLRARGPGEEVLVVAATADAAADLVRRAALDAEGAFGWHRITIARLAAALAARALVVHGRVPVGRLVSEAVVTRVLHELAERNELGRFAHTGRGPGLARALASVLEELRGEAIAAARIAAATPELARVQEAYDAALAAAGLADRVAVEQLAAEAARSPLRAAPLDLPLVLLDLPAPTAVQRALLEAVVARAPACLATIPEGDARAVAVFAGVLGVAPEIAAGAGADADTALRALQQHLFRDSAPAPRAPDPSVEMLSAPGESRECVEIARRIHAAARDGVPFDRIAVLLRAPDAYGPFLVEALRRAGVPAHFARGARRPDPSGRALLALLACAAEGCSARRFAEYLSLGEVPLRAHGGAPPGAPAAGERWVPPDEELVADRLGAPAEAEIESEGDPDPARGSGSLPAPRRWERLLVEAAVIGGRDRWRRRLEGHARELERSIAALDEPDGPIAERLRRDRSDLAQLGAFALPLIEEELANLPASARWGEWAHALGALASRALRSPERVQSVLAELAPMAQVGPIRLREVQLVLAPRLLQVASRPPGARYGKVFVAPADAVRGLAFDVVFVPGLAEKLFPRKIAEEPILLDAVRSELGGALATNERRLESERLALRLAVGAARERVVLSYPRLDVDGARPRVPSFYALEALRAAEGALPGFDELSRRAETAGDARLGWPAPAQAERAIDAAEFDLARLARLEADAESSRGAARYLLGANPHLGRALRFRARRWIPGWTPADGLVKPIEPGQRALAQHALAARSFSPTALQQYALCPYKFFLHTVWKLSPREEPEAIEELDPLQRGSLVHAVQFELFGALRDAGLLPVTPARLAAAWDHLDTVLDKVAARFEDDLAPAIERVWRDGVQSVRADLREWLRRASLDDSGFVPWRFELSFGLPLDRDADPASRAEPVSIDAGLCLRGSIDLVERSDDGRLRVTDHKTGKERFRDGAVIDGGRTLQPVLYALALEKLFPDAEVESGRLYYCTAAGNFEERRVPLDAAARASAEAVAKAVGAALDDAFLPAAPDEGACRWCDYRPICGPYEELRAARKYPPPLAPLRALRERP
jgi:CRISPR/Cas system-associated exonuclease Cas4 (RecB family)